MNLQPLPVLYILLRKQWRYAIFAAYHIWMQKRHINPGANQHPPGSLLMKARSSFFLRMTVPLFSLEPQKLLSLPVSIAATSESFWLNLQCYETKVSPFSTAAKTSRSTFPPEAITATLRPLILDASFSAAAIAAAPAPSQTL